MSAEIESILEMLDLAKRASEMAIKVYADLTGHPAYKFEGLPELLRAQEQNANAMIVQAQKLWSAAHEDTRRKN